jgi:hypothetical protein
MFSRLALLSRLAEPRHSTLLDLSASNLLSPQTIAFCKPFLILHFALFN